MQQTVEEFGLEKWEKMVCLGP